MGNEGSRPSPLRRSMSRRQSKANHNNAHQYIAEDEVDRNQEIIAHSPKPLKRMDKIRRSLSFRKKKKSSDEGRKKLSSQTSNDISTNLNLQPSANLPSSISAPVSIAKQKEAANSTGAKPTNVVKPPTWIEDEKKVRAGNCSFQVKYLGTIEVSDSRGMHLCESAIERLLAVSLILGVSFRLYSARFLGCFYIPLYTGSKVMGPLSSENGNFLDYK